MMQSEWTSLWEKDIHPALLCLYARRYTIVYSRSRMWDTLRELSWDTAKITMKWLQALNSKWVNKVPCRKHICLYMSKKIRFSRNRGFISSKSMRSELTPSTVIGHSMLTDLAYLISGGGLQCFFNRFFLGRAIIFLHMTLASGSNWRGRNHRPVWWLSCYNHIQHRIIQTVSREETHAQLLMQYLTWFLLRLIPS